MLTFPILSDLSRLGIHSSVDTSHYPNSPFGLFYFEFIPPCFRRPSRPQVRTTAHE
jgi:hypothetical protein